jgi:hypothetical protein
VWAAIVFSTAPVTVVEAVAVITQEQTLPLGVLAEVVESLMVLGLVVCHVRVILEETAQKLETTAAAAAELLEADLVPHKARDEVQLSLEVL